MPNPSLDSFSIIWPQLICDSSRKWARTIRYTCPHSAEPSHTAGLEGTAGIIAPPPKCLVSSELPRDKVDRVCSEAQVFVPTQEQP